MRGFLPEDAPVDQRAQGICEWSAALERGDLELDVKQLRGPEQQLELGLHVDVENDVDTGHDAEQEVE